MTDKRTVAMMANNKRVMEGLAKDIESLFKADDDTKIEVYVRKHPRKHSHIISLIISSIEERLVDVMWIKTLVRRTFQTPKEAKTFIEEFGFMIDYSYEYKDVLDESSDTCEDLKEIKDKLAAEKEYVKKYKAEANKHVAFLETKVSEHNIYLQARYGEVEMDDAMIIPTIKGINATIMESCSGSTTARERLSKWCRLLLAATEKGFVTIANSHMRYIEVLIANRVMIHTDSPIYNYIYAIQFACTLEQNGVIKL